MDSTDEEFYGSTSFTTKGRRTKRQRTTTSSYGTIGGGADNSYGSSASASPSPDDTDIISETTTTTTTTTATEEEQDMANCLILLAQGTINTTIAKNTKSTSKSNNNNNNNLYECKTCNKTFYSFQALGGHRTSHKKVVKQPPATVPVLSSAVPRPGIPSNNNSNKDDDTKTRIHECSICGSEFPSGQALGGHMRRHRQSHVPPPPQTVLSAVVPNDLGGSKNILSLDLNLPAPDDHDHAHDDVIIVDHATATKFHVLPTPALLDCHY